MHTFGFVAIILCLGFAFSLPTSTTNKTLDAKIATPPRIKFVTAPRHSKVSTRAPIHLLDDIVTSTMKAAKAKPTKPPKTDKEKSHEEVVYKLQKESQGDPDPEVGVKVDSWHPQMENNPEELGSYLQGDILQLRGIQVRQGMINVTYRWPKGIIYYRIASTFAAAEVTKILAAMSSYHTNTCVRFQPYTGTERDYVSIERGNTGCWSALGRVGGKQVVNLQSPGCLYYIGTIIHELMHAVGYFHEQSRIDRDASVRIVWANIISGLESNFNIYNSTSFGVGYDYGSVMHYSKSAFSKNGLDTIVPSVSGATIGQRLGFSSSDISKIRLMYKCNGTVSLL